MGWKEASSVSVCESLTGETLMDLQAQSGQAGQNGCLMCLGLRLNKLPSSLFRGSGHVQDRFLKRRRNLGRIAMSDATCNGKTTHRSYLLKFESWNMAFPLIFPPTLWFLS